MSSGPLTLPTGTADGVMWTTREDLGSAMRVPPDPHASALTPPDYYVGALPYYGDWQIMPIGSPSTLALVIEFDTPIQQFRTTAQFVGDSGLKMYAAVEEPTHDPFTGPIFAAVATAAWAPSTSGTRTLTYEAGFRFVIIGTIGISSPLLGLLSLGPTFRNTFFDETIVVPQPIIAIEPDQRVPRGAGRIISYQWPGTGWPGNPQPQDLTIRPRVGQNQVMTNTQPGGGTAGGGLVNYKGQRANSFAGKNGAGTICAPLGGNGRPFSMYPTLERPAKMDMTADEIACYRLEAILAWDNPAGALAWDCGLTVGAGTASVIRNAVNPGFSLGLIGPNTIALTTRQVNGGAAIEHALDLPGGFDLTQWHKYELRIISATFAAEALCKVLVDDVPALTLPWGAGSVLPLPINGTAYGFIWSVVNMGGTPDFTAKLYVALGGVGYHVSMTEDGLL